MPKVRVLVGKVGRKHILLTSLLLAASPILFLSPTAAAPILGNSPSRYMLGFHSSSHPISGNPSSSNQFHSNTPPSGGNNSVNLSLPPIHPGLASSNSQELRTLAEYERTAGGAVANRLMVFTDIPGNIKQAQSAAADMATTLKEFNRNGINALVIMEPTINGYPVNFQTYRGGGYDSILDSYFQALKAQGLGDEAMGMWVYFPEANLPEWGPVDLANFAPNVTRSVQLQKKYFPASQSSILLDAMSYPVGSTSWDDGSYTSLLPFVSGIPKGLLDSFGMQGFPWVPAANQSGTANLNPATFLNSSLAAPAAKQLGVSNIWLNTGTFRAMYTNNSSQTVAMTPTQRQSILSGIAQQALNLCSSGYSVEVNLFSEDKSGVAESIDWSYKSAAEQTVLVNFIKTLQVSQIGFWLFDS